MYEITLRGRPYERGLQQGQAYRQQIFELYQQCPAWLGGLSPERIAFLRANMVEALRQLNPAMVDELEGISEGSGMPFDDVCVLNFVSAIGSLGGCTNLIALNTEAGPALAKTSDIGPDHHYYSIQRVEPSQGYTYFAISWVGCLWAEVGINSAGLACGQGSAPTMPGQVGFGVPTLEYPRLILEQCSDVDQAIRLCQRVHMAGKGLNIALVDSGGQAAVVEKSGSKAAVRRPSPSPSSSRSGSTPGGVYCANHFLENEMQGMQPLQLPGFPDLEENTLTRLNSVSHFFQENPSPHLADLVSLLATSYEEGGLRQEGFPELTTHYAYLVLPRFLELRISLGIPRGQVPFKHYRL